MTKRTLRLAWFLAISSASCSKAPQDDPALQNALQSTLKDPDSAKFRMITETNTTICGEVNSKNSYGGYDGYRVFAFDRQSNELWLEQNYEAADIGAQGPATAHCANYIDLGLEFSKRANAAISERLKGYH